MDPETERRLLAIEATLNLLISAAKDAAPALAGNLAKLMDETRELPAVSEDPAVVRRSLDDAIRRFRP